MKAFLRTAVAVAAMTLLFSSCGGGGGETPVVPEDQVTVAAPGTSLTAPLTVAWPKALTASSVTPASFFVADGGATAAMSIKSPYDPALCVAANAIPGTIAVSDNGLETTFAPEGGVWPLARTLYACLTSGISFADGSTFAGKTASFSTPAVTTALTSRTAVLQPTDGAGSAVLTFTFGSVPPVAPAMSVLKAATGEAATGSCAAAAGDATGTVFACTASGLAGCGSIADYTAEVLLGNQSVTEVTFNTADDFFDSAETLTNACWTATSQGAASSAAIADGKLDLHADTSGLVLGSYALTKGTGKDASFAVTADILSFDRPGILMLYAFARSLLKSDVDATQAMEFRAGSGDTNLYWALAYPALTADAFAPKGDLAGTVTWAGPFFVCMSHVNHLVRTFVSFDGSTFTPLASDNIECGTDCGTLFPLDTSAWSFTQEIEHQIAYSVSKGIMGPEYAGDAFYDWVLYRTSGLAGTEADCPRM